MKNHLLFAALLYVSTVDLDQISRQTVVQFANDQLKYARSQLHLSFLKNCLRYKVIPKFVSIKIPSNISGNEALERKKESLELEILRLRIKELDKKMAHDNIRRGHGYLHLTRSWKRENAEVFLKKLDGALELEMQQKMEIHRRKWMDLTGRTYPGLSCEISCAPVFPFPFTDDFLCSVAVTHLDRTSDVFVFDDGVEGLSENQIPAAISNVLSKGPKYRIPNKVDKHFMKNAEKELDKMTYRIRWNNVFKDIEQKDEFKIPFTKNSVSLPPKLNEKEENNIKLFRAEVLNLIGKQKNTKESKSISTSIKNTRSFLNENNLSVLPTDKTNKLAVMKRDQVVQQTENILNDTTTYRSVPVSRVRNIENQANRLVRAACKNSLTRSQLQKLLSCGTKAAGFRTTVKDHKEAVDGQYPLRPIASCLNNPTEKIDWLVTRILTQLTKFVPAHFANTEELIAKLNIIENVMRDQTFVSLDVKNLYPSIPISDGIAKVSNFMVEHWDKIEHFGLDIHCVKNMLNFICHNYEISYNEKHYLQIKGCPMGSHFSPPFAIIYMHTVETETLMSLKNNYDTVPKLYARYIDDIIIGPFKILDCNFENILSEFNKVNDSIQFTIEVPPVNTLNFLDISITTPDTGVQYTWFEKTVHSGNALRNDSYVPSHIKHNFVNNTIQYVRNRCSNEQEFNEARIKLEKKFKNNGFKYQHSRKRKRKQKTMRKNNSYLKIKFINDKLDRQIKSLMNKYEITANLVSTPNTTLYNALKDKQVSKRHENCNICQKLPERYSCNDRFLVYKFTCVSCGHFYIGQTCRPFKQRYHEHERAVKNNKVNDSALANHIHADSPKVIDMYDLEVLEKCSDPLDTRLTEARYIKKLSPKINRKHELTEF